MQYFRSKEQQTQKKNQNINILLINYVLLINTTRYSYMQQSVMKILINLSRSLLTKTFGLLPKIYKTIRNVRWARPNSP